MSNWIGSEKNRKRFERLFDAMGELSRKDFEDYLLTGELRYRTAEEFSCEIDKIMEKKQPKRDKNGRFSKKTKTEVKVTVEPKPEKNTAELITIGKEEYEQLLLERDAFKESTEKISSMYLDKCAEVKRLKPYARHWDRLFGIAIKWRDRAEKEVDRYLFAMDAMRLACVQIGWLKCNLSWFKLLKYRKKLVEMDFEMDRLISRIEGLDEE